MPGNPRTLVHRSRLQEEELRTQSRIYQFENAIKQTKVRKTPHMQGLLDIIYEIFDLASVRDSKIKRLPATDFQFLKEDYSPPTIIRAKRILGIKSQRREGFWFWSFPKYSSSEALKLVHERKIEEMDLARTEIQNLQRAASVTMQELFISGGLYLRNVDVLREMDIRGYSRSTTLKVKAQLGIISQKIEEDGWMWIWGYRPVQDWLEAFLSTGPQPVDKIYIEAFSEHDWRKEIIDVARKAVPTIRLKFFNSIQYWVDLNSPGNLPELHAAEPVVLPRYDPEMMSPAVVRNSAHISQIISKPYETEDKLGVHMLADVDTSNFIDVDFEEDEDVDNYDELD